MDVDGEHAPQDMSKSCDKTASCVPEENVLEYLPDAEVSTHRM